MLRLQAPDIFKNDEKTEVKLYQLVGHLDMFSKRDL